VTVVAGEEIDLSKWRGAEPTAANLYAITDEIMFVLRAMVGEIRGETPPPAPSSAGRRTFPSGRTASNGTGDAADDATMRDTDDDAAPDDAVADDAAPGDAAPDAEPKAGAS
jgi:hypothetical protein